MYLLKGFQLFIHFSSVLKQLPEDNALYQKKGSHIKNAIPNAFRIEINQ